MVDFLRCVGPPNSRTHKGPDSRGGEDTTFGVAPLQKRPSSKSKTSLIIVIEYRSDDITKTFFFFAFQRFGYHVLLEHNEKHPQPKFGGNRFMGAPR